jgi:hypothetical protein
MEYEIVTSMAVLSERTGSTLEVNMVSWRKGTPKVDIRRWNEDHTQMGNGVALTDAEAKALYEALKERYE